jgi:hypothetical protein
MQHERYENESRTVGEELLTAATATNSVARDITPRSKMKVDRRFEKTYRLHLQDRREQARNQYEVELYFLVLLFGPEMEAICSSETSVGFNRSTRRYILEQFTLVHYLFLAYFSCFGAGIAQSV